MPETPLPHAGVHFPPPLIYAIAFLLGCLLQYWWPAPISSGPSTGRLVLAAICVVVYFGVFVWAFVSFRRARTTLIPNRPATRLVTVGPYRLTRNPMYVSLVALYLGLALVINSWWLLALLVVVIVTVDRMVIAREERYLTSAFPEEYGAYRARVRRWL